MDKSNEVLPDYITEQIKNDFCRLYSLIEDGEGYDIPKQRMDALANTGLIKKVRGRVYEFTEYGIFMQDTLLGYAPKPDVSLSAQQRLHEINQIIYAAGAPLGSENYFKIRELCVSDSKQLEHNSDSEDAKRYRKIKRDNDACKDETFCLFFDVNGGLIPVEGVDMDAHIDEEIAKDKHE